MKFLADLVRLRAMQVTAVAAVLLGLMQLGRMITGETAIAPRTRADYANEKLFRQRSPVGAPEPAQAVAGGLTSSDELAARKPQDLALPAPPPASAIEAKDKTENLAQAERTIVTGSNVPTAEEAGPKPAETPAPELANRKLIRNATVELEIVSFDDAVQKITAFAKEDRGYVATTESQKQANGKLRGEVVVKVVPESLDQFLQ